VTHWQNWKMNKYADNLPINARITVDYTKPNNDVKFEYPVENRDVRKWALSFIFPVVLIVWGFIVGFSFIGYLVLTNLDNFSSVQTPETETTLILAELLTAVSQFALLCFVAFVPPLLISFYIGYNCDKFKYWFPKFQAFMFRFLASNHFHTFVVDELKEPIFEIPLFRNVMLTYEASGDFSKYLQRVEIREHDFQYKGEKTQWLWKAKFVFSEVPKSGMLVGKFQ